MIVDNVNAHGVSMCSESFINVYGVSRACLTSKDTMMHYSFDFAQQVHYPSDSMQPGPKYFLTRKCGLFGVCCEDMELMELRRHVWTYTLTTAVDKTRTSSLVLCLADHTQIHHRLDLHFLIAGHTKFTPDWCFGLIEEGFRKTRVDTVRLRQLV
ncbi:hypothetical protein UPYG_G00318760 [Umbra pygmaea]|uniref:DDE-1 domain-containing protein n=1 Tax=Umbra pygmaea TaxID=75934 RepID=A0ABD0WF94_UMBPY